jgi:hypothetical protein
MAVMLPPPRVAHDETRNCGIRDGHEKSRRHIELDVMRVAHGEGGDSQEKCGSETDGPIVEASPDLIDRDDGRDAESRRQRPADQHQP